MTGQQPIVLGDAQLAIVLNVEIYNFRELRAELQGRGHVFTSQGDVEVVLRLWAEHGESCLERLNGMFAFAIWDGRKQTLFLARDRFGIKPLCLCHDNGNLAFASELRALRAGRFPARAELDPAELRHYLALGYSSPCGSLLKGVVQLPPATLLAIGPDGRQRSHCYWKPPNSKGPAPSPSAAAEELLDRLNDVVTRQLVADVPIGIFLSGGLDSSTLTALAQRGTTHPIRTFSVGFEGPGAVSELPAAREVAGFLGTEHTELMMDPEVIARDLDEILADLDSPLGDPTALPTWYMSRLARERVTVALSGEGADEVFGGYAHQRYDVTLDRLGRLGRSLLPSALRLVGRRASPRLARRLQMGPGLDRQLDWGRLFSADEIDLLVKEPQTSEDMILGPYSDLAKQWEEQASSDPVNARLLADQSAFLPRDLLPKVDRMSMAHSLEVRVPFLDNVIVDYVLPLVGKFKQSLLKDKILLRRAAADLLPPKASRRPKRGFEVPISAWLRGPLRPAMCEYLKPAVLSTQGLLREEEVGRLVTEHLEGRRDNGRMLWTLLVLSHWLEHGAHP